MHYDRMGQEVTTTMDMYDQSYRVYADSPRYETGISADSLYEAVPESERDEVKADRRINVDVLRLIAGEADANHLLIVDPHNKMHADEPNFGVGLGLSPDGGLAFGVSVPLMTFGDRNVLVATSMVWEFSQIADKPTDSLELQPVWGGVRPATKEVYGFSEDVDAIGYGFRSMIMEMRTGKAVHPSAFFVESDDPVTVYRVGQPRLRGTGVHVDGLDFVVPQEDGAAVRVPIHTVSRIKNPAQNEIVF